MNGKVILGAGVLAAVAIFSLYAGANLGSPSGILSVGAAHGGADAGLSYNVLLYKNGQYVGETHNMVVNNGLNMVQNYLGFTTGTLTPVEYISVANQTVAQSQTDTNLNNGNEWALCGLGRAAGTPGSINNNQWWINYTFTSTCATALVNSTGLSNTTSGNNLFAQANFSSSPVTLNSGDTLKIAWNLTVVS